MKSLKTKLVVVVSGVLALCMITMSVVTFFISANKLSVLSVESYQTSTEKTMNELSVWLSEQKALVHMQTMSLELMNNYDYQFLVDYLKPIVNNYNDNGNIYDLYYTSMDNVMSSGCGYVPDGTIDFTKRGWFVAALETSYAQSSENLDKIKNILSKGEISSNGRRIVYELDDNTRVIFGLDLGGNAHSLRNQGYLEPTNHMNVEIQTISESGKVYTKWDMHLILDDNKKVVDTVITGPWKDR